MYDLGPGPPPRVETLGFDSSCPALTLHRGHPNPELDVQDALEPVQPAVQSRPETSISREE